MTRMKIRVLFEIHICLLSEDDKLKKVLAENQLKRSSELVSHLDFKKVGFI